MIAHDYRREISADGERCRLACSCGKRSRWSTAGDAMRAQDRHADDVARRGARAR